MKNFISSQLLCLLTLFGATAVTAAVHSSKVILQPTKLEKDSAGLQLEVSMTLDGLRLPEHSTKIMQRLGSVLLENALALDRHNLITQFDQDKGLFRFRIKQELVVAASQKGFSACIAQWFSVQTNEVKAQFNKAYLSSDDIDNLNSVRSSVMDYFSGHLGDCIKLSVAIPTEDIQYFTNVYVENRIRGKVHDLGAKNLASLYDQSYGVFQVEADKNMKTELLSKTAKYFDSFANIGLNPTADLDALGAGLAEQKPMPAARLLALTLSGFLDSLTLAQAFELIEQGQKTLPIFDRSLNWVSQIFSECVKEYLLDPAGHECRQKLTAKDFYWIEFSRAQGQFKFLIII